MFAVTRCRDEQLRKRKRSEEDRRVVLAEAAQLGVSGYPYDLEKLRLRTTDNDSFADWIVTTK